MRIFFVGVIVGAIITAVVVASLYFNLMQKKAREAESKVTLLENEIKNKEKEAKDSLGKVIAERDNLRREVEDLKAENSHLEEEAKKRAEQLAELKRVLDDIKKKTASEPENAPVDEKTAEEQKRMGELQKRIMEIMEKSLVIGNELSDSVVKDLDLSETQRLAVNDALKDEASRMSGALKEFIKNNSKIAPDEVDKMDFAKLVMNAVTAIMDDVSKLQKIGEDKELAQKAMEGKFDLIEYLGKNSPTVKLGYALYKERRKTIDEISRHLTSEQTKKINETYLRDDIYTFPPHMPLSFYGTDFSKLEE
jgi:hypothetical protein